MYSSIKRLLFRLDPEEAHHLTMKLFKVGINTPILNSLIKNRFHSNINFNKEVFGLKFKNPVGLAAGFDKDGRYFQLMENLGFGFIEIGTVTPRPQIGNPRPRLFRLPQDKALINRMGFNNEGVDAMVRRLSERNSSDIIIGGNIGKNKDTPNEKAVNDYIICLEKLHECVDYFVVNVSSPNTPGLRELQEKEPLKRILSTLIDRNNRKPKPKPILVKISPDMTIQQYDDIIEILSVLPLDGLIVTNTTISRENLVSSTKLLQDIGNGGVSGAPLSDRSFEILSYMHKHKPAHISIVSVGGIDSGKEANRRLQNGADLVQIYTGLIYQGPSLIKNILKQI